MGYKDKLNAVTRGHEDVDVLLDRELLAERKALLAKVEGEQNNPRLTHGKAAKELAAFNKRINASLLTVRVMEISREDWRLAQIQNPAIADKSKRSVLETRHGYNVVGAAIDAIEEASGFVDDGEFVRPSAAEWKNFFLSVQSGDMVRLTSAVVTLQEHSGLVGYEDAKKA